MKQFYKLNPLQIGSGSIVPDDFIVYTNDNIPSELQEALDAEQVANELLTKIAEAKAYLASTDFKMTVDYFATMTVEKQEEFTSLRAEAREFIRVNQGVQA
jgi:hypothetical protein